MKIYVVQGIILNSDRRWIIRAFIDEKKAQQVVVDLTKEEHEKYPGEWFVRFFYSAVELEGEN